MGCRYTPKKLQRSTDNTSVHAGTLVGGKDGDMSLHRYKRVHYYEVNNRGLKGKPILNPSSKESGYAGTYKKGNIHVRSAFYKSIDLVIRNTPVYEESGLISTSFELPVPFSNRANEEQSRYVFFHKMSFDFYADMKKEGINTIQHWDVDESEYLK